MREATVRVTAATQVHVDPEQMWALVSGPAAFSAGPGNWFAFAVPVAVPGTDRLCCMVFSRAEDVHWVVLDVREEIPGQLICWQAPSVLGQATFTLRVQRRPRGCALGVALSIVVPRAEKRSAENRQRRFAEAWARRLKAIAEGRMPRPPTDMPAELREKCAGLRLPDETAQASASVLIDADAGAVWETVWAPESARLVNPDEVVWAGTVPGTPHRAAGEMQCRVRRDPDGRCIASLIVRTELTEGRRLVTQTIRSPTFETVHLVTPVPAGIRLELTTRWPELAVKDTDRSAVADGIARRLQETAERYKALAEKAGST